MSSLNVKKRSKSINKVIDYLNTRECERLGDLYEFTSSKVVSKLKAAKIIGVKDGFFIWNGGVVNEDNVNNIFDIVNGVRKSLPKTSQELLFPPVKEDVDEDKEKKMLMEALRKSNAINTLLVEKVEIMSTRVALLEGTILKTLSK